MEKLYRNKEWLKEKYINQGLNTIQIGAYCEVDNTTIGYWLRKFNIPRRPTDETFKNKHHTEEAKLKMSKARKGKKFTEEHKRHINEAAKGRICTLETKRKISEAKRGIKLSLKQKEKISEALKGRIFSDEHKKCLSVSTKRLWNSIEYREKVEKAIRQSCQKDSCRNIHSRKAKKLWQDVNYKNKVIKAMLRGIKAKPNKAEKMLNNILNNIIPREFKYVGDGQIIIDGKYPDFINCNGKKQIIELFGDYWHRGESGSKKIKHYKKYGYSTLIVWEHELDNLRLLCQKILRFTSKNVT